MVSAEDLTPILQRRKEAHYLTPVVYGYLVFKFPQPRWLLYLAILTLFTANYAYIEKEIREDLGEYFEDVNIWVQIEFIVTMFWAASTAAIPFVYLCWIDWRSDFWVAALGFLSIAYISGWLIDEIYAYKYGKHYVPIKQRS